MSRGGVDKSIVGLLVEAAGFDLGGLLLLVDQIKVFADHHQLSFSDHNEVTEVGSPLNLFDDSAFWQTHFVENFPSSQIIHHQTVVSMDKDAT